MTGAQVASIFSVFGSRIFLFQRAQRILPGEDEDVSAAIAVSSAMRVDDLVRIPLSFPTYTGILVRAAHRAVEQPGLQPSRLAI